MFGPPQIFPPVPINEPGNGPQGVTLEVGVPVFVGQNAVPALSTGRGAPLTLPTTFSPAIAFNQEEGIGSNPQDDVIFEPGIPAFEPEDAVPALSTGKGAPLNFPLVYSPPVNFQQQE